MALTRPEMLAWAAAPVSPRRAMGWPTVTGSPGRTRGVAGPSAHMSRGMTISLGVRDRRVMGLRRVISLRVAGYTPPKKEWVIWKKPRFDKMRVILQY